MNERLTRLRGILLINADGEKYFIEAGIKPYKEEELEIIGRLSEDLRPIPDARTKAFQEEERGIWLSDIDEAEVDTSNLGPFILQAFNVVIEIPDRSGESTQTASNSEISLIS